MLVPAPAGDVWCGDKHGSGLDGITNRHVEEWGIDRKNGPISLLFLYLNGWGSLSQSQEMNLGDRVCWRWHGGLAFLRSHKDFNQRLFNRKKSERISKEMQPHVPEKKAPKPGKDLIFIYEPPHLPLHLSGSILWLLLWLQNMWIKRLTPTQSFGHYKKVI